MFKGNRKYYFVFAAVFIGIVVLQYFQPKPTDWKKSYMQKDKIPFGCYAMVELMKNTYSRNFEISKQSIYNMDAADAGRDKSLILINDQLTFSKLDTKQLFRFLAMGNKVLLCANTFDGKLADTLHIQTNYNWFSQFESIDSLLKKPGFSVRFVQPDNNTPNKKPYFYNQAAVESYFSKFDSTRFKVIAVNQQNKPLLIHTSVGSGELYLCTTPDAFTNLFIVNSPTRYYPYALLSLLKNNTIIWDEYYKTYNVQTDSPLKFIFNSDALYMAWLLLVLGVIIFMIFEFKRRQRPIEVVKPLENSTLRFVDVISHVYFNSGNHLHIAEEKIQYFYFDIRQKFHVNTHVIDTDFMDKVSKLSGVDYDAVKTLFTYCERLRQAPSLTEYDLIELNNRINNFKQKSIR
ncbi:MAG: DUF4350 domain-containing protein [Bacteroidetes bacterium]|nr:DUF4350 domain-containing protein [Bacteroidota bacterium]